MEQIKFDFHSHHAQPSHVVMQQLEPDITQVYSPYFSVSYYPWVEQYDEQTLYNLASQPECKAIGETGLDLRYPLEKQLALFDTHIALSQELGKPLIIHCVRAYDQVLQRLKKHTYTAPVLFHGFNKSLGLANQLLAKGHLLSFGRAVISQPHLLEVVKACPIESLAIESDDTAEDISPIYSRIAEIKQLPLAQLTRHLQNTFHSFYSL